MAIYIYSDKKENAAELVSFAKERNKKSVILTLPDQLSEMSALGADLAVSLTGVETIENGLRSLASYLSTQDMELFLVGNTMRGRDVAARIAGYLEVAMSSDVNSITEEDGAFVTERMTYGGRVVAVSRLPLGSAVTIGKGRYPLSQGQSPSEEVPLKSDERLLRRAKTPIVKEAVDLSASKRILSVGMGLAKEEDLGMVREVAAAIGAEVGCSRGVAEEKKWLPLTRFVGISGNVISPDLYLAAGISGQVQHLYGVKDAKIIVGVNNNEKAPIFRSADYGIVGDLYRILPLIREKALARKQ